MSFHVLKLKLHCLFTGHKMIKKHTMSCVEYEYYCKQCNKTYWIGL